MSLAAHPLAPMPGAPRRLSLRLWWRSLGLAALGALALAAGCAARAPRPRSTPLAAEGLVLVYLAPTEQAARRVAFAVESVSAEGPAGAAPLERHLARVDLSVAAPQRLLASARLAPGNYDGLSLKVGAGVLVGATGAASDLVAPESPVQARGPFQVQAGAVTTLSLLVTIPEGGEVFRLAPAFHTAPLERPIPTLSALVAGPDLLVQLDRRTLRVGAVEAVLRGPAGVAVDGPRGLAYATLADGDAVDVLDLGSGERLRELRLQPGDRPGAIALTPDGAVAVVIARGPEVAVFLDAQSGLEVGRAAVGQDPRALVLDRQGRFAYAVNRASNSVTVLDVANRAAAGTLATDPAPVGVAIGRAGDRLYVAHAGSAYLATFRLPERTGVERRYVGLGASAVQVDARTGLIALAMGDDRTVRLLAPGQEVPVAEIALPGAATRMLVDDVEQALVVLVPEARRLLSIDLATRRVKAAAELPEAPADLALTGERK